MPPGMPATTNVVLRRARSTNARASGEVGLSSAGAPVVADGPAGPHSVAETNNLPGPTYEDMKEMKRAGSPSVTRSTWSAVCSGFSMPRTAEAMTLAACLAWTASRRFSFWRSSVRAVHEATPVTISPAMATTAAAVAALNRGTGRVADATSDPPSDIPYPVVDPSPGIVVAVHPPAVAAGPPAAGRPGPALNSVRGAADCVSACPVTPVRARERGWLPPGPRGGA